MDTICCGYLSQADTPTREFGFKNRNLGDFTRVKRVPKPFWGCGGQPCRIISVKETQGFVRDVCTNFLPYNGEPSLRDEPVSNCTESLLVMQRDKPDAHGPRTGAGGSMNRSGSNDSETDPALGEMSLRPPRGSTTPFKIISELSNKRRKHLRLAPGHLRQRLERRNHPCFRAAGGITP